MKKLQILALAMLFAMTGMNPLEANIAKSCAGRIKSNCTGSCEWRHKGCRKKVKVKSASLDSNNTDTNLNDTGNDNSNDTPPINPPFMGIGSGMGNGFGMGSGFGVGNGSGVGIGSGSYAPQRFTPAPAFAGSGLVGNYFSNNQVATISDPSGQNQDSYNFENVVSSNAFDAAPDGLTLIGTSKTTQAPKCSPGGPCSNAFMVRVMNLYGEQVSDQ